MINTMIFLRVNFKENVSVRCKFLLQTKLEKFAIVATPKLSPTPKCDCVALAVDEQERLVPV